METWKVEGNKKQTGKIDDKEQNNEEGDDYDWMSCKGVKWNEIISAVKWVRLACDSVLEVLEEGLGRGSLKEIAIMKRIWIYV